MDVFRAILSVGLFIGAIYVLSDGVTETPVSWTLVAFSVGCFVAAYAVWPSKKRGHRQNDHPLWDILEFLVELPVEATVWLVRGLARTVTGKGGGVDLDF